VIEKFSRTKTRPPREERGGAVRFRGVRSELDSRPIVSPPSVPGTRAEEGLQCGSELPANERAPTPCSRHTNTSRFRVGFPPSAHLHACPHPCRAPCSGSPPARTRAHEDGEEEVDVLLGKRNSGDRGLTFGYSGMKN